MQVQFTEKWHQYSLMAELVLKLKGISPQLGKTVLQKLVYILQEVYRVPCGYDYTLYNYGPYSADLADDLSFFAAMEGAKIEWNQGWGYKIEEAEKTEHFRERGKDFLDEHASKIDKVIKAFGSMNAKELELRSTIIYISKKETLDRASVIHRTGAIKPHFTREMIEDAYAELEPVLRQLRPSRR